MGVYSKRNKKLVIPSLLFQIQLNLGIKMIVSDNIQLAVTFDIELELHFFGHKNYKLKRNEQNLATSIMSLPHYNMTHLNTN